MVCFWYPGFWWLPTYRTSEHHVNSSRGGGIVITKCFLIFEHEIKPVECEFKCSKTSIANTTYYSRAVTEHSIYLDCDLPKWNYIYDSARRNRCYVVSEKGKTWFSKCYVTNMCKRLDNNFVRCSLELTSYMEAYHVSDLRT